MTDPIPQTYRVTQEYKSTHKGLDIAPLKSGTQGYRILASERFKVTGVVNHAYGGLYVVGIGQETNTMIYWGHLASAAVKLGQIVAEGTLLGIMGFSGSSVRPPGKYGTHTHMYAKKLVNGSWVYFDPREYLNRIKEEDKVVEQLRKDLKTVTEIATIRLAQLQAKDQVISDIKSDLKIAMDKTTELSNQVAAITKALENEKNKPAEKVVETVEKIVEVEKVVEVEKPITDKRFIDWLVSKVKSVFGKDKQ